MTDLSLVTAAPRVYEALESSAVVAQRPGRTHLELTGDDRAAFFHGLCTADVKKLSPGQGTEAFLCNVQGKLLGYVDLFCGPTSLQMETVPGQGELLWKHLDRYLFREKVELHDRSSVWDELILAGPEADARLAAIGGSPLATDHEHREMTLADQVVQVRRLATLHPVTYQLVGARDALAAIGRELVTRGAVLADSALVEVARVERGFPEFGRELSDDNLPQEADRDARAISFQKGCYLGQETVARIDAVGQVQWKLTGLVFPPETPPPANGTVWTSQGKPLARIQTVVYSPRRRSPLALAFLRRGAGGPGATLVADQGQATVVALPLE